MCFPVGGAIAKLLSSLTRATPGYTYLRRSTFHSPLPLSEGSLGALSVAAWCLDAANVASPPGALGWCTPLPCLGCPGSVKAGSQGGARVAGISVMTRLSGWWALLLQTGQGWSCGSLCSWTLMDRVTGPAAAAVWFPVASSIAAAGRLVSCTLSP